MTIRRFGGRTFFLFLVQLLVLVAADGGLLARSPAGGEEVFVPALMPAARAQSDLIGGITPRDIFGRQTCSTGKYCSVSNSCCPTLSTCCSQSCTPALGKCCSDGSSCGSNKDCCGDGCMPFLAQCCGDGSYCTMELGTCRDDKGTWKCRKYISGGSSSAAVKDAPAPGVLGGMVLAGLGGANLLDII